MTESLPPARSLRIHADQVRVQLEAGVPVLFLDARSVKAWNASTVRVRGAVRIRPAALVLDPGWNPNHLTVIYCA